MAAVIVIGAGISGLTTAWLLVEAGHEVAVLEGRPCPGGRIQSERVGGFLMEHGANGVILPAPAVERLIEKLALGPERVTRSEAGRRRYLMRRGRLRPLPIEPQHFFLAGYLSVAARLRMLLEPFVPANHADETVADFTRRRFGGELLDYVVDPVVAGLFAGDPEQLSVCAAFPQLKRLERCHGSVIGGVIRSRVRRGASDAVGDPRRRMLSSFRRGLRALPSAAAERLAGRVLFGHRVEAVKRSAGGGFRVDVRGGSDRRSIAANSVVVALPAYAAASVLEPLDPRIAQTLGELGHPPLAVAFLGYPRRSIAHPLDGAGALLPAIERRSTLGILFSSTLFAGRAPPGYVALTVFVGGARQPELATLKPAEIRDLAHGEVTELLGGHVAPVVARVRRWGHGLPQPGVDHAQRLASVAALESEHAGLFLTGNYFSGVSTAACAERAVATAGRVARHLAVRPGRVRLAA
jgi:oxygen-dependent protoporphyrinogen oxidase